MSIFRKYNVINEYNGKKNINNKKNQVMKEEESVMAIKSKIKWNKNNQYRNKK